MHELNAGDEVTKGDRLRVHFDGETVEGEVTHEKYDGEKVGLETDDGEAYTLFVPQYSFDGWDLQRGGRLADDRTVVTRDADKVEVLD